MSTLTYTGSLVITSCWCGIRLAIPDDLYGIARWRGIEIHCPLGHTFVYDDTLIKEKARLEQELSDTRAGLIHARDERDFERRRVIAYKGVLGKTKKRIAAGVCPCCTRAFQNLARHIATKHPEYPKVPDLG